MSVEDEGAKRKIWMRRDFFLAALARSSGCGEREIWKMVMRDLDEYWSMRTNLLWNRRID